MLLSKKVMHFAAIFLSLTVVACTGQKEKNLETSQHIVPQGDFGGWDQSIKNVFHGNRLVNTQIKSKYAQSQSYHPVSMGQSWIADMGALAASNADFREEILDEADGNKGAYAKKLVNNPQAVTSLSSAHGAFRDVLNYIAQNDAVYNDNKTRLQAYARRQPIPNVKTQPKNINYFSLHDYSTTSSVNPSVMERILNVAALYILESNSEINSQMATSGSDGQPLFSSLSLNESGLYTQEIARLSQNGAMTGCFERAKRNSQQCQAAAYDNYDLSYCMAQHNVSEVASCFSWMLP